MAAVTYCSVVSIIISSRSARAPLVWNKLEDRGVDVDVVSECGRERWLECVDVFIWIKFVLYPSALRSWQCVGL